jgi:hypothetical protein
VTTVVHRVTAKQRAQLLRDHPALFERASKKGVRRAAERHRREAVEETPVHEGYMRRAWEVHDEPGTGIVLDNDMPHAPIIEVGRRAGKWPPGKYDHTGLFLWSGPIYRWVWLKRRDLDLDWARLFGEGRKEPKNAEKRERLAVARLAYFIARKIEREGTEPKHIIASRLERWAEQTMRAVTRALNAEIKSAGGKP